MGSFQCRAWQNHRFTLQRGMEILLEGSANRLQLLQLIQRHHPIEVNNLQTLQQLLGRLYGSEREQAVELLATR